MPGCFQPEIKSPGFYSESHRADEPAARCLEMGLHPNRLHEIEMLGSEAAGFGEAGRAPLLQPEGFWVRSSLGHLLGPCLGEFGDSIPSSPRAGVTCGASQPLGAQQPVCISPLPWLPGRPSESNGTSCDSASSHLERDDGDTCLTGAVGPNEKLQETHLEDGARRRAC